LTLCLVSWLLLTKSPIISGSLARMGGPTIMTYFNPLNRISPSSCPWKTTQLNNGYVQLTVYIYKQNPPSLSPQAIARSLVAISPCHGCFL
jgi:hypothetical protein